jgi:hypothetical protein
MKSSKEDLDKAKAKTKAKKKAKVNTNIDDDNFDDIEDSEAGNVEEAPEDKDDSSLELECA